MPDMANLKESEIKELNETCLNMVYADLVGYDNIYDGLWLAGMRKLLASKILCIYSYREATATGTTRIDFCKTYKDDLNDFVLQYKLAEDATDGSVESTIPESTSISEWSE